MPIKTVIHPQGISNALANLPKGHAVVLDIDDTLLRNAVIKYGEDRPMLTEASLPSLLNYLHETGQLVILLTARNNEAHEKTCEQLSNLGLHYDVLLHAPHNKGQVLVDYLLELNKVSGSDNMTIKGLHIFDDRKNQLTNIKNALAEKGWAKKTLFYHYQPSTQYLSDEEETSTFPKTLKSIKKLKSLGGGTASTFKVIDTSKQQNYVLKFGNNEEQIKLEILANLLYKHLGVAVPDIQAYRAMPRQLAKSLGLKHTTRVVQLAEWLGTDCEQEEEVIIAQARRDFVIHAFMGNIDISKKDNFIQTKSGEVALIDAGASFIYRSLGQLRAEESTQVSEIDSMRDKHINSSAARWFGSLSEKEISKQVEKLIDKRDIIETTIWQLSQVLELPSSLQMQLVTGYSHRLDNLATRYGFTTQAFAKHDKAAIANKTAAGVMHLQRDKDGQLSVLLSRRVGHNWCDNFGGKSEAGDVSLLNTAKRETKEESNDVLQYSDRELAEASFHDIITQAYGDQQRLYRMYFVETIHPVDIDKLQDAEHTSHHWVSLAELEKALIENKSIIEEGKSTIQVKDMTNNNLIIFPPLYQMLNQKPVKALIHRLLDSKNKWFKNQHTQGEANYPDALYPTKYRPLTSPQQVKTDVIRTQIKKASVLNEIKHQRHRLFKVTDNKIALKHQPRLTQSEWHLKTIMGEDFDDTAPCEKNLTLFLDKYDKSFSKEQKLLFIPQALDMIKNERENPDRAFFYHGTTSDIAYAYRVYKAIYQILTADMSCDALRTDNALFHRCLDIQEFIAHFERLSHDGKVYNYDRGYMECALSTNLFLFGSHSTKSSYTVSYYKNNNSAEKARLKDMLLACLQPMGVGTDLVDRFAELANRFPQRGHGALYQISLPMDEVSHYAYTAKPGGRLNPFTSEQGKTTDVSLLLKGLSNSIVTKNYIESVQARVMLPPAAPITTRSYYWNYSADAIMQLRFDQQLEQLAEDAAFAILQHRNQFNNLNSKSALMRYLPEMQQQAGLNLGTPNITDELMIQLVEASDFESIKIIVEAHPEYKEKPLLSKRLSYINQGFSENNSRILLQRLLAVHHSGEIIRAIYGDNFYEGRLDKLPLHQIIAAISASKQLEFVVNHRDSIQKRKDIAVVLSVVPEEDRLSFLLNCPPNIKKIDGFMVESINRLPAPIAWQFIIDHLEHIKDIYQLTDVFKKISDAEQLELFATLGPKIVKNTEHFVNILNLVSEENRLNFLLQCPTDIKKIDHFLEVGMKMVPKASAWQFAKCHLQHIKFVNQLLAVVEIAPDANRLELITGYPNLLKEVLDFCSFLQLLPETDKLAFALSYRPRKTWEIDQNITYILNRLPEKYRTKFITLFLDNWEEEGFDISMFFEYLPEAKLIDFANKYHNKLTCGSYFSWTLDKLPSESQLAFATQYKDQIIDCSDLCYVLKALPEEHRLSFATLCQDKVKTEQDLWDTLVNGRIPEKDRLIFVSEWPNKIKTMHSSILQVLHKQDRLIFAIQFPTRPKPTDHDFNRFLKAFPEEERAAFLSLYPQQGIKNSENLYRVLKALPKKNRLAFFTRFQDKTRCEYDPVKVLNVLSEEDKKSFFVKFQENIRNTNETNQDDEPQSSYSF